MRTLVLLSLVGCFASPGWFADNIEDVDGDGVRDGRFGGPDCDDDDPTIGDCDVDRDGFRDVAVGGTDCDDANEAVHPEAAELCDSIDNDCDGLVDNADPDVTSNEAFRPDADGDGFGDATASPRACPGSLDGTPLVLDASDCDDADPGIHPNATEQCGDAVDNDCDGGVDDIGQWFDDADGDGFGLGTSLETGPCADPGVGYASIGGDCDDGDGQAYPGAPEIHYDGIDQNCGGLCDDYDDDGDLYVGSAHWVAVLAAALDVTCGLVEGDCDDTDADRYVGNTEVCDGIDNDCNNLVDTEDLDSAGPAYNVLRGQVLDRYADFDGDTYHGTLVQICPADDDPLLYTELPSDCFDSGPTPSIHLGLEPEEVHPGADEVCDGADNDCDDRADWDNVPFPGSTVFYLDDDGDGFGDAAYQACNPDAFAGLVAVAGDCDDARPDVYPGAEEICGDLIRQDCDHLEILVNGALVPTSPWDCDADGYEGSYNNNGSGEDCEDELPDVNPGVAQEICDGLDNDCDGLLDSDDAIAQSDFPIWYRDADGDGFANVAVEDQLASCGQPAPGYVLALGDCNDADASLNPNTAWYLDADADGFGRLGAPERSCLQPSPDHLRITGDCDDTDARYNPDTRWLEDQDGDFYGAEPGPLDPEVIQCLPPSSGNWAPAFFGTDCDDTDPDVVAEGTWYRDADGDGVGVTSEINPSCSRPPGYSALDGDCDDDPITGLDRTPGRLEICDGIDNDCDEAIDDEDPGLSTSIGTIGFQDNDGDGFGSTVSKLFCIAPSPGWTATTGDCDDDNPDAFPGNPEVCFNGADDDCDGTIDQEPTWYSDEDADGFGAGEAVVTQCQAPQDGQDYSTRSDDCDDGDALRFPGAEERDVCDAIDDNCDGTPEPRLTWYPDLDQDGFGDDDGALVTCTSPTGDWVLQGGDCDDADPNVTFGQIWYLDADGDTLGNPASTQFACPPDDLGDAQVWLREDLNGNGSFDPGDEQLSVLAGDCDDTDPTIADARFFYADADADGWGVEPGEARCPTAFGAPPEGFATRPGDCDDTEPGINPDQPVDDEGDQIDTNCDGSDGVQGGILWYPDDDGDGLGDANTLGVASYTPGWRSSNTDCDDTDPNVGNGLFLFPDADSDGVGGGFPAFVATCTPLPGTVLVGGDCADSDATRFPGAVEACNGLDDDCDGAVSVLELDLDQDGFRTCGIGDNADCDDLDPLAYPFNADPPDCDGSPDSDCDPGTPDDDSTDLDGDGFVACDDPDDLDPTNVPGAQLWYLDQDGDQYGVDDPATNLYGLTRPPGYVALPGDCDDTSTQAFPGFPVEFCDGVDNDCNGVYVIDSLGQPNFDVTNPFGLPNFVEPDFDMAADLDGNGIASLNSSFVGCGDIPGPTGTVVVQGDAYTYEMLPPAGGLAAVSDCDDGTGDQGVPHWGDIDGDGLGHPVDGYGVLCPGDTLPPGFVPIPSDFRMDCWTDNPEATYTIEDGEYGDADGDGGFALQSDVGSCVRAVTTDPSINPDCDDFDSFLPLTQAQGRFTVSTQAELDLILQVCEGYIDVVVNDALTIQGTFKPNSNYRFRPGNQPGPCSAVPTVPDVGGCLALAGPVVAESGSYVRLDGIPLQGHLEIQGPGTWVIESTVAHDFSVDAQQTSLTVDSSSVFLDTPVDPSIQLVDGYLELRGSTLRKAADDGTETVIYLERSNGYVQAAEVSAYRNGIVLVDSSLSNLGTISGAAGSSKGIQLTNSSVYGSGAPGGTGSILGFDYAFEVAGTANFISSQQAQQAIAGVAVTPGASVSVDLLDGLLVDQLLRVEAGAYLNASNISADRVRFSNQGFTSISGLTTGDFAAGTNAESATLVLAGGDIGIWSEAIGNAGSLVLQGDMAIVEVSDRWITGTGTTETYGGTTQIGLASSPGPLVEQTSASLGPMSIGTLGGALVTTQDLLTLTDIDVAQTTGAGFASVDGGRAYLTNVHVVGNGGSVVLSSTTEAIFDNVDLESGDSVLTAFDVDSLSVHNSRLRGTLSPALYLQEVAGTFVDSTLTGEQFVLDIVNSNLVFEDSTLWSHGAGVARALSSDITLYQAVAHNNGLVVFEQEGGSLDLQYTLLHDASAAVPRIDCLTGSGRLDLYRVWTEDAASLLGPTCTATSIELVDGRLTLQPDFVDQELQPPLSACLGPSSSEFLWPCF